MEEKKEIIFNSSQDALVKIFVLLLTLGISIFASFIDSKSCYITVLVQACNNIYDFYKFTNNKKYVAMVKRESIIVIMCSLVAIIIVPIIALLGVYEIMQHILMRVLSIFLVTIPIIVIYNDYKINVYRENEIEE